MDQLKYIKSVSLKTISMQSKCVIYNLILWRALWSILKNAIDRISFLLQIIGFQSKRSTKCWSIFLRIGFIKMTKFDSEMNLFHSDILLHILVQVYIDNIKLPGQIEGTPFCQKLSSNFRILSRLVFSLLDRLSTIGQNISNFDDLT